MCRITETKRLLGTDYVFIEIIVPHGTRKSVDGKEDTRNGQVLYLIQRKPFILVYIPRSYSQINLRRVSWLLLTGYTGPKV